MVMLTEIAAERVKALAAEDPEAKVLRLAVEGGGCSGFQYAIGFDSECEPDDVEIDSRGVRVVIDPISLPYLQGSTIDYHDGLMGAGFSFDNPKCCSTQSMSSGVSDRSRVCSGADRSKVRWAPSGASRLSVRGSPMATRSAATPS